MKLDYAKGLQRQKKSMPLRAYLTVGLSLAIGGFTLWAYLAWPIIQFPHQPKVVKVTQPVEKIEEKLAKPEFDFYTLLPKLNVPVNTPAQGDTKPSTTAYLIQVAALKNASLARNLQTQLADKGFRAEIIPPKADHHLYRITIGPYVGITKANEVLEALRAHRWYGLIKKA